MSEEEMVYKMEDAEEDAFDLIETYIEQGPNQFDSIEQMKETYAGLVKEQHIMPMELTEARSMVELYFQRHADFVFRGQEGNA